MADIHYRGLLSEARWESWADFAASYWSERGSPDGPGPAVEFMSDLSEAGDNRCFDALDAIVQAARDADALCSVGAGPLEDLLSHHRSQGEHVAFMPEVEARARQDAGWRSALACVWLGDDVPPEVRQRLVTLGAKDLTAGQRAPD